MVVSTDLSWLTVSCSAGVTLCAVSRMGRGDRGHAGAPDEAKCRQAARGQAAGAETWGAKTRLTCFGKQRPAGRCSLGLGCCCRSSGWGGSLVIWESSINHVISCVLLRILKNESRHAQWTEKKRTTSLHFIISGSTAFMLLLSKLQQMNPDIQGKWFCVQMSVCVHVCVCVSTYWLNSLGKIYTRSSTVVMFIPLWTIHYPVLTKLSVGTRKFIILWLWLLRQVNIISIHTTTCEQLCLALLVIADWATGQRFLKCQRYHGIQCDTHRLGHC